MLKNILASLILCFGLLACAPTVVDELFPDDRDALQVRVTSFEKAFQTKDYAEIASVTPPRVTAHLAELSGTTPEAFQRASINQMREALKRVPIVSYGMSIENAQFRETRSGRNYALIPTQTVVRLPSGGKVQSNSFSLAFMENGKWYLVRLAEGRQTEIFKELYPEFRAVKVPPETTKTIS